MIKCPYPDCDFDGMTPGQAFCEKCYRDPRDAPPPPPLEVKEKRKIFGDGGAAASASVSTPPPGDAIKVELSLPPLPPLPPLPILTTVIPPVGPSVSPLPPRVPPPAEPQVQPKIQTPAGAPCVNPNCRHLVRPGNSFCAECGQRQDRPLAPLVNPEVSTTVEQKPIATPTPPILPVDLAVVRAVRLEILDFEGKGVLGVFPLKEGTALIGAADSQLGFKPDIDLDPFDTGDIKYISRKHAVVQIDGGRVFLIDVGSSNQGSTNGTYVDTQKLTPLTPVAVNGMSKIRFAQLSARVVFS